MHNVVKSLDWNQQTCQTINDSSLGHIHHIFRPVDYVFNATSRGGCFQPVVPAENEAAELCSVCSVCRSCAVPLCPVRSLLRRSVCGPTWWSISRCTDARPTTTPASRGRTTPAPGTAASPHPRRSSWTARSLKKPCGTPDEEQKEFVEICENNIWQKYFF